MPISVLDVAKSRGIVALADSEFERVGLPSACQCYACGKLVPPRDACPTEYGRIMCMEHVGSKGFKTTDQFEKYITLFSLHKKDT